MGLENVREKYMWEGLSRSKKQPGVNFNNILQVVFLPGDEQ